MAQGLLQWKQGVNDVFLAGYKKKNEWTSVGKGKGERKKVCLRKTRDIPEAEDYGENSTLQSFYKAMLLPYEAACLCCELKVFKKDKLEGKKQKEELP